MWAMPGATHREAVKSETGGSMGLALCARCGVCGVVRRGVILLGETYVTPEKTILMFAGP